MVFSTSDHLTGHPILLKLLCIEIIGEISVDMYIYTSLLQQAG